MELNKQLAIYKMNSIEKEIWNRFREQIIQDCKKMQIEKKLFHYVTDNIEDVYYQHSCGFAEGVGYYKIDFGDRGEFVQDILQKEFEDARFAFLERILWCASVSYECINREKLQDKWNYKARYDGRKNHFEYTIRALYIIFPFEKLEEHINKKSEYMNRWFNIKHWDFDKEKMEFIEVSNSEEHN